MSDPMFPPMVYTLWWVILALTYLLFVPIAVYWLTSLLRTALSIRRYAQESLVAAQQIEKHTSAIPAVNGTIEVATEILAAAEAVAHKLDTIATVLETRAGRA